MAVSTNGLTMTGILQRRWARISFVLAVNVALMALILAGAEAYARYLHRSSVQYWSDNQLPMCEPDEQRIWHYRPGVDFVYHNPEFDIRIRTNDERLRGPPLAVSGEGPLVLFIGDSMTFGWGVEDDQRFSEVVQSRVAAKLGAPVRVINAGHWMYTYDQQLLLLKDLLKKYRPQVVVQGLYWPHVRTLFGHQLKYDEKNALIATADPGVKVDAQGLLRFRSDWLERPPLDSQLIALVAREVLNRKLVREAAEVEPYMTPGKTHNEELWGLTQRLLSETARVTHAAGAAYVPFYLPMNVETADTYWLSSWGKAQVPEGLDVRQPFRRLDTILSAIGEKLNDPTQRMREAGSGLYFTKDVHLTAEGHRVVGEFLAPAVIDALNGRRSADGGRPKESAAH
jgi:lysophospholipase L1-like esterase